MKPPQPVLTARLLPRLLTGLVDLLSGLSPGDWSTPVPRKAWTVHDVAVHLLGGDVGVLSRERDRFTVSTVAARTKSELVQGLKRLNDTWVEAGRRLSPRLLCDLLAHTGGQAAAYLASLDPQMPGEVVSWAGPGPAPNWLHVGREYTERWHHQQHIREALRRPGFDGPEYLKPALEISVWALPETYRGVEAPEGTFVAVTIAGESGGDWMLVREGEAWRLYAGTMERPDASVVIPQEAAWKVFTRWMPEEEATTASELRGDTALARRVFRTAAVIA